jgi:hypothetical protein
MFKRFSAFNTDDGNDKQRNDHQLLFIGNLALVAINGIWATMGVILGLSTLAIDYLIYFNGDFGLTITNSGNEFHGTVMNGFNITCIFVYFVFLLIRLLTIMFINMSWHFGHTLAGNSHPYRNLVQKKAELKSIWKRWRSPRQGLEGIPL